MTKSTTRKLIVSQKAADIGDRVLVIGADQKRHVGTLEKGSVRYDNGNKDWLFKVEYKIVEEKK